MRSDFFAHIDTYSLFYCESFDEQIRTSLADCSNFGYIHAQFYVPGDSDFEYIGFSPPLHCADVYDHTSDLWKLCSKAPDKKFNETEYQTHHIRDA